jgi:tyrosinase
MFDRRMMMGSGLAAAGLLAAGEALAAPLRTRVSWQVFRTTPSYNSFRNAVATMKANHNASDPNSWYYWANVHQNFCPHGQPYFLAWHRGYIYRFEQQIRAISGDPNFNLPYWDYFTNANLPAEFTSPANSGNPLWTNRVNTNVAGALGYGFTQPQYVNFPRNWPSPMEPQIESLPHNQVHNIIGGFMPTMQSPQDPIFWVHHGNIDRLWCAWVAAGGGRTMPGTADPYWNGGFVYGASPGMPKVQTRDTTSTLGYTYDNERLPRPTVFKTPKLPTLRALPLNGEKTLGEALSLGDSVGGLTLDNSSFSVRAPLGPQGRARLGTLRAASPSAAAAPPVSIDVVLDDVALTEIGKGGGYYYKVYVNLPAAGGAPEASHLIGTVGAFEIAGARHHADGDDHADHGDGKVSLVLPATDVLRGLPAAQLSQLVVSFVRVDGAKAPKGPAITIGDFSIQASAAPAR